MEESQELDGALREIAARRRQELGDPPTEEEIFDYWQGRLDERQSAVLERKIEVYPEAARYLADLRGFPDVGAPEEGSDESQGSGAPDEDAVGPRSEERRSSSVDRARRPVRGPWRPPGRGWLALAAGLMAVVIGAAFLSGRFLAGSRIAPVGNVISEVLQPAGGSGERSVAEPGALRIPPGAQAVALTLVLPDDVGTGPFHAELRRQGGDRRWASDDLHRLQAGTLQLLLPRELLAVGAWTIEVRPAHGDGARTVRFEVIVRE